ncbi:Acyltransferase 3 [Cordyceps fumosorosea ARSEF 2679]|uniref:Acyltransferase 3 n=1 Tax=Cordyceps fumosorosea (strain ARSEF 2679) TaxID=1081104 RepID=A0A167N4C6_CORFA|nr:Acyltransferase 3 [Cordyceps fumosorosea ARSEF 2679]OAA55114.1 Acyltransferase 3 [Cordyceps fumosorosea ARSEF 2679]
MELSNEKHDLLPLATEQPRSLYDTAVMCGRYLGNRAASVSRSIRSSGSAATSPRSASPSRIPNHHHQHHHAAGKPSRGGHSPTAYLSGIRGVAAVIVFIFHATWAHTSAVDEGYGYEEPPRNRHILQLPFLRIVHAGHAMVGLFFLIGGYVNAAKPLRLIRAGRHAELVPAVAGGLLRRAPRLYLPALAAMLTTALLTYAGAFEPARANLDANPEGVFYWPDFHPGRQETLAGTLADWRAQAWQLCNPWRQPFWTHYDPHLWTVTLEFRASLVVSLALAGVACCRVGARMALLAGVTLFMARCDRWEVALFLTGAVLAELDLMRKEAATPTLGLGLDDDQHPRGRRWGRRRRPTRALGVALLAIAGLYLMSFPPNHGAETPGFAPVARWLVPAWTDDPKRYVHGVGATLFLVAAGSSPTALQRPFLAPAAQYLGKVSYALYVVHGPVLHAVGYVVTPAVLAATGGVGPEGTEARWAAGMVLATAVNFAVSLGVADLFYRVVDVGSVRLAVAFQKLCTQSGY